VAYLRLVDPDEAVGELAREYEAARNRSKGKLANIVRSMSLRPGVLHVSMALYREIMFGPSELSRVERELLAVVTSAANDCHY
jgi:alkylhydroperoxidase family enzyme